MKPSKPTARENLQAIESQAQEVRRAATELSNRIKKFEKWLGSLPGRVQACTSEPDDMAEKTSFNLSYTRQGKEWVLEYFLWDEEFSHPIGDSMLLRDASIETKARAVRLFPKLLEAIREAQTRRVREAEACSAEFDALANELGIKEGE